MRKIINANDGWHYLTTEQNYIQENKPKGLLIKVPGEMWMNGIAINHNEPYYLYKVFEWNDEFKNKDVVVKFNGVYSYVDVFVEKDNTFEKGNIHLLSHIGGFTPFEINISDHFVNGKCKIKLRIEDSTKDLSMMSAYSKHPITGILRDIELLVLPKERIESFRYVATNFSDDLKSFDLKIDVKSNTKSQKFLLKIWDKDFKFEKVISNSEVIKMSNLKLWCDEIPNLYNVSLSLVEGKDVIADVVGFRKIEIKNQNLFVNNKRVMLRGINRHDLDLNGGRIGTKENDEADIKLLKEANINFVRTSHYPATKYFLQLCDVNGIYVENETPICMLGGGAFSHHYNDQSLAHNPYYENQFIKLFDETVDYSFNRASIIIWSLGNENVWGDNFKKMALHARELKDGRLLKGCFPGTIGSEEEVSKYSDVLSIHYVDEKGFTDLFGMVIHDFKGKLLPTIHDEFAHVPSYNIPTLKEDPNVFIFWAKGLKHFMDNFYTRDGIMGGAVWCYQDEVFNTPASIYDKKHWVWEVSKTLSYLDNGFTGPQVGYGNWGIIDIHRQRKPQFFALQQAYHPLQFKENKLPKDCNEVILENRYSFLKTTDFVFEITNSKTSAKVIVNIDNWKSGTITIPSEFINSPFEMKISSKDEIIKVQKFEYELEKSKVQFNESSFKIEDLSKYGLTWVGPHMIKRSDKDRSWCAYNREMSRTELSLEYKVKQNNETYEFDFEITVDKSKIEIDRAHAFEIGVLFEVNDIDGFEWERSDIYNFPENELGGLKGKVSFNEKYEDEKVGQRIVSYAKSRVNHFMYGDDQYNRNNDLSNVARSSKEDIKTLVLHGKSNVTINFLSDTHVRFFKDQGKLYLAINSYLDYPDIAWGNNAKKAMPEKNKLIFLLSKEN